jgi:hypothetical protein
VGGDWRIEALELLTAETAKKSRRERDGKKEPRGKKEP